MNFGKLLICIIKKKKSQEMGHISIGKGFVVCIWLIDLAFGEFKSLQIRQSNELGIECSANPDHVDIWST